MKRLFLLLLLALASSHAFGMASASCPYYAINSSKSVKCFKSLAEAETFIRQDTGGAHPLRRYLVQASVTPQTGSDVQYNYAVKPIPGTEGPQSYSAISFGSPASGTVCGCDSSGSNGRCVAYGSVTNCSNTPALCTYGFYCRDQSSVIDAIKHYIDAQNCKQNTQVALGGALPAYPLAVTGAPNYGDGIPPNTVGLAYWWENPSNSAFTGEEYDYTYDKEATCGAPGSGKLESRVTSQLTCPPGWKNSPSGSPVRTSDACKSIEYGIIYSYRPPTGGGQSCPDGKCGRYGNPVIAATGAKIQTPLGWNRDAMLGVEITYNSFTSENKFGILGVGWNSLLTSGYLGVDTARDNFVFEDEEGNLDQFRRSSVTTLYRALNSTGKIMRGTSSSPCERTIFDGSRRIVSSCDGSNRYVKRVEYPAAPEKNLQINWSTGEAFNAAGEQIIFPNVPVSVVRADGRRLDLIYTRVNPSADCSQAAKSYACNVVRLSAISDSDNNLTLFEYDADARLSLISYPDGTRERFEYAAAADICPASMPGACPASPAAGVVDNLLTGTYIETPQADGSYTSVRYGTYQYDNMGRAIVTTHANDAGRTEFRYAADGTPTVRTYSDATHFYDRTITAQRYGIYNKAKGVTEKSSTGAQLRTAANAYNTTLGYVNQSTDFRGTRTDWTYADNGLLTQKVDAANDATGTLTRTTQTDWDATNRLLLERRSYDSTAGIPGTLVSRHTNTYNARGQVTASCDFDPADANAMTYVCGSAADAPTGVRQSRTTYCEQADVDAGTCPSVGLVVAVDGPRTDVQDVSQLTYYPANAADCAAGVCSFRAGDLWTSTNALGQFVEYLRYDGAGRVLAMKDANGTETDLEYSPRGWLLARKVRGSDPNSESDDAITRMEYDANGQVTRVTQPDGVVSQFEYDVAHRVTAILDAEGNRIDYTLDEAGHRIKEETKDVGGTLRRSLSRLYDDLGQLQTALDANAQPTGYTYDVDGAVDTSTDALGRVSDNDTDALGRVIQSIANVNGDASDRAVTQYTYDTRDQLVNVVDPKGLSTHYTYNAFGDQVQLDSPDTGTTTFTYDSAGNRVTQTDARGVTVTYQYDALNRLTGESGPTAGQDIHFDYDVAPADCAVGETYALGRLAQIRDGSGSTRYCYDGRGNLVRKVQQVNGGGTYTTGMTYDAAGRLMAMTYPSGAIVVYQRDANGRIVRVDGKPSATEAQVTLVSSVEYLPYGPISRIVYGNGRVLDKTYDQNYEIQSVADNTADGISLGFTPDAVGNLTGITERLNDGSVANRVYDYDGLNRLTRVSEAGNTVEAFSYNSTGDRLSYTTGSTTQAYDYAATDHRLLKNGSTVRSYDAAGHTITQESKSLDYDDYGRMSNLYSSGTATRNYLLNGKNERVATLYPGDSSASHYFVYDAAGHIVSDFQQGGARFREFVWLDDVPVAEFANYLGGHYQYLLTDHLNTPRAMVEPTLNKIVWRWDLTGSAFGSHSPDQNPDGDNQNFSLELRFPGQYNDPGNYYYNYFRNYEPSTGRYIESDLIGLRGGASTYSYVGSQPEMFFDSLGLTRWTGDIQFGTVNANLPKFGEDPLSWLLSKIVSGSWAHANLNVHSDCKCHKWMVAHIEVNHAQVHFGANVLPDSPIKGGSGTVTLLDNNDDPTAESLEGPFALSVAGYGASSGTVSAGAASGTYDGVTAANGFELTGEGKLFGLHLMEPCDTNSIE